MTSQALKRQLHMCLLRNQFFDAAMSAVGYALLHEAYEANPDLKAMGCPLSFNMEDNGKITLPEGEWDSLQLHTALVGYCDFENLIDNADKFVESIARTMAGEFQLTENTRKARSIARDSFRIHVDVRPSGITSLSLTYHTVSTKEPQ